MQYAYVYKKDGGFHPCPDGKDQRRQPQLQQHRACQNCQQHHRKLGLLRVQDLIKRGFQQINANDQNQRRNSQAGQVLKSGVTVGMVLVGGHFRQLEAQEGHDGAGSIGEVVHGIGCDGDRAAEGANGQFSCEKQGVAADAHQAGQGADLRPDTGIGVVLIVPDK